MDGASRIETSSISSKAKHGKNKYEEEKERKEKSRRKDFCSGKARASSDVLISSAVQQKWCHSPEKEASCGETVGAAGGDVRQESKVK